MRICEACLFPVDSDVTTGGDTPVALAALELLSSLAQLQFDNFSESFFLLSQHCRVSLFLLPDHRDSRLAVHLVSEYIQSQAMKDLPRHNRDLHTSIVAAFSTLLVWIQAHPYLLGNKVCACVPAYVS